MSEWVGFTDDDLKRLKSGNIRDTPDHAGGGKTSRGRPVGKRLTSTRGRQPNHGAPAVQRPGADITADQMLAPPKSAPPAKSNPSNFKLRSQQGEADGNNNAEHDTRPGAGLNAQSKPGTKPLERSERKTQEESQGHESQNAARNEVAKDVNLKELDETEGISRELSHMVDFQQQQKMIEERNKKKREMLAKAIQERQKAAKAESKKLLHIQQELGKLDQMLNADVAIIRDKIEEVSREFLEAQRHYERIERQFIEAKIELHHKEEQKESLTEHLYTIIHQNELRKAKKLEELTQKLELECAEETLPELATSIPLPQLAVINPMQFVKTPHSPGGNVPTSPSAPPGEQPGPQRDQPEQASPGQPGTETTITSQPKAETAPGDKKSDQANDTTPEMSTSKEGVSEQNSPQGAPPTTTSETATTTSETATTTTTTNSEQAKNLTEVSATADKSAVSDPS